MKTKDLLTVVALLFAILAYIPYIKDTLKRKTRPHAFSWLIWGTMSMVAFYAQYSDGGGAGTWAIAFTAVADYIIFFFALYKGEHTITITDWLSLLAAFVGLGLWTVHDQPPMSLILISAVGIVGFIPTVRKSMEKPQQETISTYVFLTLKYVFAVAGLERFTFITMVFPTTLGTMHGFFVWVLISRRRQLGYGIKGKKRKSSKRVNYRSKPAKITS